MIEAEGLTKHFGDVEALAGLDLAVPSGKVLAILGPNGAGKTTLIRTIATLTRPTAGHACGSPASTWPQHPKQVRRTHRPRRAVRRGRARVDRPREPPHGRAAVRARPRGRQEGRRRGARPDGPHRRRRPAGAHLLGRHAAPPRPRAPASSAHPACCCSTSRPPVSTRAAATSCGSRSRTWRRAAPTCCSPPSTSTRPTASPTPSRSSTTASSWRPAPATSSRRSSAATSSTCSVKDDADLERAAEALGAEATIDAEHSRVSLPVTSGADELVAAVQALGAADIALDDIALRRPDARRRVPHPHRSHHRAKSRPDVATTTRPKKSQSHDRASPRRRTHTAHRGRTTALTVGGRTTLQAAAHAAGVRHRGRAEHRVPADVPLRPRRRDRRQRRHLRRVPRPRIRRVGPPVHRRRVVGRGRRGRRVGALRPAAVAAHLRSRRARRSGHGRRRADGARRARHARRRLHHRLPHAHARSPDFVARARAARGVRARVRVRVRRCSGSSSGNAQAAQGLSILAVPFSFISSAFVPIATMPGPVQAFAKAQPLTFMVNSWRGLLLGDAVTRTFDHGLSYYVVGLVAVVARDRRSCSRRSRCARTARARSRENHSRPRRRSALERSRPMRMRR